MDFPIVELEFYTYDINQVDNDDSSSLKDDHPLTPTTRDYNNYNELGLQSKSNSKRNFLTKGADKLNAIWNKVKRGKKFRRPNIFRRSVSPKKTKKFRKSRESSRSDSYKVSEEIIDTDGTLSVLIEEKSGDLSFDKSFEEIRPAPPDSVKRSRSHTISQKSASEYSVYCQEVSVSSPPLPVEKKQGVAQLCIRAMNNNLIPDKLGLIPSDDFMNHNAATANVLESQRTFSSEEIAAPVKSRPPVFFKQTPDFEKHGDVRRKRLASVINQALHNRIPGDKANTLPKTEVKPSASSLLKISASGEQPSVSSEATNKKLDRIIEKLIEKGHDDAALLSEFHSWLESSNSNEKPMIKSNKSSDNKKPVPKFIDPVTKGDNCIEENSDAKITIPKPIEQKQLLEEDAFVNVDLNLKTCNKIIKSMLEKEGSKISNKIEKRKGEKKVDTLHKKSNKEKMNKNHNEKSKQSKSFDSIDQESENNAHQVTDDNDGGFENKSLHFVQKSFTISELSELVNASNSLQRKSLIMSSRSKLENSAQSNSKRKKPSHLKIVSPKSQISKPIYTKSKKDRDITNISSLKNKEMCSSDISTSSFLNNSKQNIKWPDVDNSKNSVKNDSIGLTKSIKTITQISQNKTKSIQTASSTFKPVQTRQFSNTTNQSSIRNETSKRERKEEEQETEDKKTNPLQKARGTFNNRRLEGKNSLAEAGLQAIDNTIKDNNGTTAPDWKSGAQSVDNYANLDKITSYKDYVEPAGGVLTGQYQHTEQDADLHFNLVHGAGCADAVDKEGGHHGNKTFQRGHEKLYLEMMENEKALRNKKDRLNVVYNREGHSYRGHLNNSKKPEGVEFEDPFLKRLQGLHRDSGNSGPTQVRNVREALQDIMDQPNAVDTKLSNAATNQTGQQFVMTSMAHLEPGIEAGASIPVGAERCRFYWVPQDYRDFLRVTDHPISSDYFPADNRVAEDRCRDGIGSFRPGGRPRFCVLLVREVFHVNLYLRMHPDTGDECYAEYTVLLWGRDQIPVAHYRTPVPIPFGPGNAHNVATLSCPAMLDLLSQNVMTVVVYLTYFPKWKPRSVKDKSEHWHTANPGSHKSLGLLDSDTSRFELLLRTRRFADMEVVVCGHRTLQLHRNILTAESPVIREIIEASVLNQRQVVLPGFDTLLAARQFIYYLYTGHLGPEDIEAYDGITDDVELACSRDPPPRWVQVLDQLCAGIRYRVPGLVRRASCWLAEELTVDNAATVFLVASSANIEHLIKKARGFILQNLEMVQSTPGWNELKNHSRVVSDLLHRHPSDLNDSHRPLNRRRWTYDPRTPSFSETPLYNLTAFSHVPLLHESSCCLPRHSHDGPAGLWTQFNGEVEEILASNRREVEKGGSSGGADYLISSSSVKTRRCTSCKEVIREPSEDFIGEKFLFNRCAKCHRSGVEGNN